MTIRHWPFLMLEQLGDKLQRTLKVLRGQGRLTEKNIKDALREVRLALLEADVNYQVAKDFCARVEELALGAEVLNSVTPGQQLVKIVHDVLVHTLGGAHKPLDLPGSPSVVMLCGLQGSGKTTTAGKLALHLMQKKNRRPLLAAADVYRPAAVKQLQVLGEQIDAPVLALEEGADPVAICKAAVDQAKRTNRDVVFLDTAGRLHIDDELMQELERIKAAVKPHEVLFVADALTGQEAVNVAKAFHERLGLTGVVLTKMDGDARGGAALSIHQVTGCALKFIGVGEKLDALEPFHPERLAGRILGMGDIVSLVEKAADTVDMAQAEKMVARLTKAEFTLEDFLEQLQQVKKMGPLGDLMKMMPGAPQGMPDVDEKQVTRTEAIIQSMTLRERRRPQILNGSRRKRIAAGSGTHVADVNRLIKQFTQAQKMMKKMLRPGKKGRRRMAGMPGLPGLPGMNL